MTLPDPAMERHLKAHKHLKELTTCVSVFLRHLDAEMVKPSTVERGGRIAKLSNMLEMANDGALHFGLNQSFGKISRTKRAIEQRLAALGGQNAD